MEQSYLQNEEIVLRALEPEDLELVFRIENNPEVWFCSTTMEPYSRYVIKNYIESMHNDVFTDKEIRLVIEQKKEKRALGFIDLFNFEPLHNRAEVGIVVDEAYRHLHIGTQALHLLVRYSFSFLHINQLYAYIASNNEVSRKLFKTCGFTECGTLRSWLRREHGYEDVVFVQCLSK